MTIEIPWAFGRAVIGEVAWGGAKQKPERAQGSRHQPGIRQIAAADSDIDLLIDQVDDAIVEIEIEFDFGIALNEFRQHRQQQVITDDRNADAQAPAWSRDGFG